MVGPASEGCNQSHLKVNSIKNKAENRNLYYQGPSRKQMAYLDLEIEEVLSKDNLKMLVIF